MSQISEIELNNYDIEVIKKICIDCNINKQMLNNKKEYLIKMIMFKEKLKKTNCMIETFEENKSLENNYIQSNIKKFIY